MATHKILFGHSVSLAGNAALVGAPSHQVGANTSQGAAYVFTGSGGTWSQQADLTAADGAPRDQFGFSVSLSGNTAVGGAFGHEVGSSTGQGASYVFNPSSLAVSVSGSQTSGSSGPTFTYAPAGAGLTGNLTCSTVDGGTAIGPALAGGSYTIDGPSCGGLISSTGDVISYAGANDGFVVNQSPASPPPASPPATSATTTTTTTTSTTPSTTTTDVATSGRSGTTTTTTIGPHPRVHLTSPSAIAFGVYLHVKLSCEMAACAGAAEVTERALIKTHEGKKNHHRGGDNRPR